MRRDHSRMALRKVSIPTLRNQVEILTLRRAILEWNRFLLCAEHIYYWHQVNHIALSLIRNKRSNLLKMLLY